MIPESLRKKGEPKFKGDSYEATLTSRERERLHARLRSNMPIGEVLVKSVRWRHGENKGELPTVNTLYRIRNQLNLEIKLCALEGTVAWMELSKKKLQALVKGAEAEKVIDEIMALISQEVIALTLHGLNPENRNAAARLLLKRSDQRRVDRKLDMLEAEMKKEQAAAAPGTDIGLTPEEKKQRMREILHID